MAVSFIRWLAGWLTGWWCLVFVRDPTGWCSEMIKLILRAYFYVYMYMIWIRMKIMFFFYFDNTYVIHSFGSFAFHIENIIILLFFLPLPYVVVIVTTQGVWRSQVIICYAFDIFYSICLTPSPVTMKTPPYKSIESTHKICKGVKRVSA